MLDKYRQQIDLLDEQIIELLEARFEITSQIGEYKREHQIPVLNEGREQQIINKLEALELTHQREVTAVYLALMNVSKGQQDE